MGVNDINSLAHSKWTCKYHIVFAPKYRRSEYRKDLRQARQLLQIIHSKDIKGDDTG